MYIKKFSLKSSTVYTRLEIALLFKWCVFAAMGDFRKRAMSEQNYMLSIVW